MSKIKIILLIACGFLSIQLSAQDELPSGEVEVIKTFNARLAEAAKVKVRPDYQKVDTITHHYNYSLSPFPLNLTYSPPNIRPVGITSDKVQPGYNGYIKLGYGYPKTPYGYAGYQFANNETVKANLSLKHYSGNNSSSVENQKFMDNDARFTMTYYTDLGLSIDGSIGYSLDDFYQYGYGPDTTFLADDIKRRFKKLDAHISLQNAEENKSVLNYNAGLDFYRLTDNYSARETGVLLKFGIAKYFGEEHPLALEIGTDFTTYKDTSSYDLHNFYAKPSFTYHGQSFRVKLGANITSNNDEFEVFPMAEVSTKVVGNQVVLFLGVDGGLSKNNLNSLSTYNPFIVNRMDTLINTKYSSYFVGFKGSLSTFDYEFKAQYKSTDDLALFLKSKQHINQFDILYEDVDIFSLSGTFETEISEGLSFILLASKNFYSPDIEEEAWHLPLIEFNGSVNYKTAKNKLLFKAEVYYADGLYFQNDEGNKESLNTLLDLSLGAEYFIGKNVGVFAEVNNIANSKWKRWQDYPTFGLNAIGGISARF